MKKATMRWMFATIRRIIRKDANLQGELANGKGKFCVIGGLAHFGCGISEETLSYRPNEYNYIQMGGEESKGMSTWEAISKVHRKFPVLSRRNMNKMVIINDATLRTLRRRKELLAFVNEVAEARYKTARG